MVYSMAHLLDGWHPGHVLQFLCNRYTFWHFRWRAGSTDTVDTVSPITGQNHALNRFRSVGAALRQLRIDQVWAVNSAPPSVRVKPVSLFLCADHPVDVFAVGSV